MDGWIGIYVKNIACLYVLCVLFIHKKKRCKTTGFLFFRKEKSHFL